MATAFDLTSGKCLHRKCWSSSSGRNDSLHSAYSPVITLKHIDPLQKSDINRFCSLVKHFAAPRCACAKLGCAIKFLKHILRCKAGWPTQPATTEVSKQHQRFCKRIVTEVKTSQSNMAETPNGSEEMNCNPTSHIRISTWKWRCFDSWSLERPLQHHSSQKHSKHDFQKLKRCGRCGRCGCGSWIDFRHLSTCPNGCRASDDIPSTPMTPESWLVGQGMTQWTHWTHWSQHNFEAAKQVSPWRLWGP